MDYPGQSREPSMNVIIKFASAALVFATSAAFTRTQAAESVVGSWRMVSWIEEETESKAVHKNFGDHPLGLLTYTTDGRMMIIFADPTRKPSATPKATDAEAAQLYRTMVAYAGSYSLDGDKITHKIEVSWNQLWKGTSQQRLVEVRPIASRSRRFLLQVHSSARKSSRRSCSSGSNELRPTET